LSTVNDVLRNIYMFIVLCYKRVYIAQNDETVYISQDVIDGPRCSTLKVLKNYISL
jgi:hypothetical protein